MNRLSKLEGLAKAFGVGAAAAILSRRLLKLKGRMTAQSGYGRVVLRPCDSDIFVAAQTFGYREYDLGPEVVAALRRLAREWRDVGVTPLIIDAGASVGYSALFFAETYPEADVVAIEVDPESADMLRLNTRHLPRVQTLQTALWRHNRGVTLKPDVDNSWANTVEEGGDTPSLTLDLILDSVPNGRILMLKLDIEGAEREVAAASGRLISEIPCVIAEPHDWMLPGRGSLYPLLTALGAGVRDTIVKGENIAFIDSALLLYDAAAPATGSPDESSPGYPAVSSLRSGATIHN